MGFISVTDPRAAHARNMRYGAPVLVINVTVHDPQLEKAVLGCVLVNPEMAPELLRLTTEEDFFTPSAKLVLGAIAKEYNSGRNPDFITVHAELKLQGLLDDVGSAYCTDCVAMPIAPAGLQHYVEKLQELTAKRREDPNLIPTAFDEAQAVEYFLSRIGPLHCVGNRWFVYNEGCWRLSSRDEFLPVALAVQDSRRRNIRNANSVISHAEARCQVPESSMLGAIRLQGSEVLINVRNGVLKVGVGRAELLPHSADYNFTLQCAVEYNPRAEAPAFNRLLAEALPEREDQNLLQAFAGSILLPSARHETALICFGAAGSGKSTIFEAIAGVFDGPLVSRMTMAQLCSAKGYHVPALRRAVMNLGTELDSLEVEDGGAFKKIVSGEAIEAREIYGEPFTMETTAKLVFLANSLPRFKNGTDGERRRMRFLLFDRVPPTPDPTLKDRLAGEKEGIFLWMVCGLSELLQTNCIPQGGRGSRQAMDRFSVNNNPIRAFIEERCTLAANAQVRKSALLTAFAEFLADQGLSASLADTFLKRLYEQEPDIGRTRLRSESGNSREQYLTGISLRAE